MKRLLISGVLVGSLASLLMLTGCLDQPAQLTPTQNLASYTPPPKTFDNAAFMKKYDLKRRKCKFKHEQGEISTYVDLATCNNRHMIEIAAEERHPHMNQVQLRGCVRSPVLASFAHSQELAEGWEPSILLALYDRKSS